MKNGELLKFSRYSITAYEIKLFERQKFYGDIKKDNAIDKLSYIEDTKAFVNDFIYRLKHNSNNNIDNYLKIEGSNDLSNEDYCAVELRINYGKLKEDFLTVESNGNEHKYIDTKIVKYYKVYFFCKNDGSSYLVVFRNGYNSCKTAIFNEMKAFLKDTNVLVSLPYTSNNEYIENLYNDIEPVSLSFSTMYRKAALDNVDGTKIINKKFSTTCIDLGLNENKHKYRNLIMGIFSKNTNKQAIVSQFDFARPDQDNYSIDPNSFTVIISVGGVKRTVLLNDEISFYDVDITSRLVLDKSGKPTDKSIREEIFRYVNGLHHIQ